MNKRKRIIKSAAEYRDFLAVVIVCAPDDFFEEDFLEPDEQLNLQAAIESLRDGLAAIGRRVERAGGRSHVLGLIDQAECAYESGDDIAGARKIQELERILGFSPLGQKG